MKAAPRKGSHSRLTHTPPDPPTSEQVPANDTEGLPEIDSGEFDRRMLEEWARLALLRVAR